MLEARRWYKSGTLPAGQAKSLIGTSSWAPRPRDLAPPWLSLHTCYVHFTHRSGTAVAIVEMTLRTTVCKVMVCEAHPTRCIRRCSSPGTRAHRVSAVDGTLPDAPLVALLRCPFSCLFDRTRCLVLFPSSSACLSC